MLYNNVYISYLSRDESIYLSLKGEPLNQHFRLNTANNRGFLRDAVKNHNWMNHYNEFVVQDVFHEVILETVKEGHITATYPRKKQKVVCITVRFKTHWVEKAKFNVSIALVPFFQSIILVTRLLVSFSTFSSYSSSSSPTFWLYAGGAMSNWPKFPIVSRSCRLLLRYLREGIMFHLG